MWNAGPDFGDHREPSFQIAIERRRAARIRGCAGKRAQLRAMSADRRKLKRSEQEIEVAERTPAHQRQGAAGLLKQALQGSTQRRRTQTSRGVGAKSRMVPSMSRSIATLSRSMRSSGMMFIKIQSAV